MCSTLLGKIPVGLGLYTIPRSTWQKALSGAVCAPTRISHPRFDTPPLLEALSSDTTSRLQRTHRHLHTCPPLIPERSPWRHPVVLLCAALRECLPWRLDTLGCVNTQRYTWLALPTYRSESHSALVFGPRQNTGDNSVTGLPYLAPPR